MRFISMSLNVQKSDLYFHNPLDKQTLCAHTDHKHRNKRPYRHSTQWAINSRDEANITERIFRIRILWWPFRPGKRTFLKIQDLVTLLLDPLPSHHSYELLQITVLNTNKTYHLTPWPFNSHPHCLTKMLLFWARGRKEWGKDGEWITFIKHRQVDTRIMHLLNFNRIKVQEM